LGHLRKLLRINRSLNIERRNAVITSLFAADLKVSFETSFWLHKVKRWRSLRLIILMLVVIVNNEALPLLDHQALFFHYFKDLILFITYKLLLYFPELI
jgi:hypothetical protein